MTETFSDILVELDDRSKENYTVYIDEGLDPVKPVRFATKEVDIFSPYFQVGEGGRFGIAHGGKADIDDLLRNRRKLEANAKGHLDANGFRDICKLLDHGLYDVYGKITHNAIEVIGFLNPSFLMGFESVTFIVAIFNQSTLALCLRELHRLDLREYQTDFQFFDTHLVKGQRVEVFHLLNAADSASKTNLKKLLGDEHGIKVRVIDAIAEVVDQELAGRDYCWAVNREFEAIGNVLRGRSMPMKCNGLNAYKECDAVAMLGCANPQPWQAPILKEKLNLDDGALYETWNLAPVYQAIGRCSIRDRDSDDSVTLIVLAEREAKKMVELFIGATFKGQLGKLERLGKHNVARIYTPKDNVAYSKYRKKLQANGEAFLRKDEWYESIRIRNIRR